MNTTVNLAGVTLKNPVMTASGTFGSGKEYAEFVDLHTCVKNFTIFNSSN